MGQGSHIQIQVKKSHKGRIVFAFLHLLLALSLILAEFASWLQVLTQPLLAWGIWSGYRSTVGLGATTPATICREQGNWYITRETGSRQRIERIRAGVVRPWLLSAQLRCEHDNVSLVAFDDAVDATAHWALRSLVLSGIPPQRKDAKLAAKA